MDQSTAPAVLTAAAARRMSNQLARAFRGTYGARTGLRTIVRSLAQKMIAAGASEDAVSEAFERCVLDHPARLEAAGPGGNLLAGDAHCTMLVALTRMCVADVALQVRATPPIADVARV